MNDIIIDSLRLALVALAILCTLEGSSDKRLDFSEGFRVAIWLLLWPTLGAMVLLLFIGWYQ